jgi:hypothetical protein
MEHRAEIWIQRKEQYTWRLKELLEGKEQAEDAGRCIQNIPD